jgi:hypothetical protein
MSDEFLLSLRHSLHHLYDVARTLSWLHFLPDHSFGGDFSAARMRGQPRKTTDPVRTVRYVVVGSAKPFPRWKEPERSMRTMKRP